MLMFTLLVPIELHGEFSRAEIPVARIAYAGPAVMDVLGVRFLTNRSCGMCAFTHRC